VASTKKIKPVKRGEVKRPPPQGDKDKAQNAGPKRGEYDAP